MIHNKRMAKKAAKRIDPSKDFDDDNRLSALVRQVRRAAFRHGVENLYLLRVETYYKSLAADAKLMKRAKERIDQELGEVQVLMKYLGPRFEIEWL
jgi:hypothetical protein